MPSEFLAVLATRRLTNSEIRLTAAICLQAQTRPGQAIVSLPTLALAMGTKKDKVADLIRHAQAKGIIEIRPSGLGKNARLLVVNEPWKWKVPG